MLIGKGRKQLVYDENEMTLSDRYGNVVKLTEKIDVDIEPWYFQEVFSALYVAQNNLAAVIRDERKTGIRHKFKVESEDK